MLVIVERTRCNSTQDPIKEFMEEFAMESFDEITPTEIADPMATRIFVNGEWLGIHR